MLDKTSQASATKAAPPAVQATAVRIQERPPEGASSAARADATGSSPSELSCRVSAAASPS
ncbi:MAG: hypothetical protein AMS25_02780 [Gemmatimonas sp. SM23_52]|nr:MAG: hypothetical protein AMS25_02780 [Gemmatimonas sp. SM23_52]